MNDLSIQYRKILLIAVVLLFAVSALIFFYFYQKNPYGNGIAISNLSLFTKDKPDRDTLFSVEHNLYEMIQRNNDQKTIGNYSVKDIIIRDDSFEQTYEKSSGLYSADFIVDSSSLSQSYRVQYQWADKANEQIDQYGILVSCLPKDMLTMGEFSCVDLASDMSGESDAYLLINWYSAKDTYNNSIDSQIQPYEIAFIETQILGDYQQNHTLKRKDVHATIVDPVIRNVADGNNSLEFNISVEKTAMYRIFIDYNDGRYNSITNQTTGIVIDRRTE